MPEGIKGFQKGKEKTGGRQKGVKNFMTRLMEQSIEKYEIEIENGKFIHPFQFYVDMLNDTAESMEFREKAASILLPYFAQKLPALIEQTNIDAHPKIRIEFVPSDSSSAPELNDEEGLS